MGELHSKCLPKIREIHQKIKEITDKARRECADAKFKDANKGSTDLLSQYQFMKKVDEMGEKNLSFEEAGVLFQIAAGQKTTNITMDQFFVMVTHPEARERLCAFPGLQAALAKTQAEIAEKV